MIALSADLTVIKAPIDLAGGFAPSLTFAGDLTVVAGGPWTPNLLPGLNIWLDASQLALADGAQVSAWANAGSGPPAVFQDSLPLATFKTNQLNGKSVVRLGTGGSRIRFTGTGINKDYTVAYVARNWGPTGGTGGRVVSSQYPAGGNVLLGYWDAYMDVGFAGAFFSPDHKILFTNDWRLYSCWCNSATPEIRLYSSGVFIGGQGSSAVSEGFGGTFNINGINDALDETCNCDIAEVLLYDRQLSDSDRIQVENYLNAKWLTAPVGIVDLTGDLAPALIFAADLTIVTGAPANYVDFAGNIGGVSSYGKGVYGRGLYSRIDAFAPVFAGAIDIVGQDFFNGDLAPIVTFAGALTLTEALAGDLALVVTFAGDFFLVPYVDFSGNLTPVVTLGGDLTLTVGLAGDLAPQIALEGLLGLDQYLTGDLSFRVDFAASGLISGPLWADSEPCPTPPWAPTDPCPPPVWAASEPCPPSLWTPVKSSTSPWTPTDPCDPVEWEDSELCDG